jgi:uncharacterized protein (DUF1800 family)
VDITSDGHYALFGDTSTSTVVEVSDISSGKLTRTLESKRQLYEIMVDFWFNHFNVYAAKGEDRYYLTSYERDVIAPHALGKFKDLVTDTAKSPAMLFYLDNWRSSVPRPYAAKGDKPAGVDGGFNENYARELLELHTLGVDGGYTQKDVQEVARCFSGWTIQKPNEQGLFLYRPGLHDDGEKVVLGHKILPGGGIRAETAADVVKGSGCRQLHASFAVEVPESHDKARQGYSPQHRLSQEQVAATRAVVEKFL